MAQKKTPPGLTRRAFMARGGAAVAVLYLPGQALAQSSGAAALSEADAATHVALYEALAEVPSLDLQAKDAKARTNQLAEALERSYEEYRGYVHELLADVERGEDGRAFTSLNPRKRAELLQGWAHDFDGRRPARAEDRRKFATQGTRNRIVADAAVALVVHPFYIEVDGDLAEEVTL
jgi:hypothetical protein